MKRVSVFVGLLVLLAALVVCVLAVVLLVWQVPVRAERVFGKPSANLDLLQRVQLSYRLLQNEDRLKQPFKPSGEAQEFEINLGESTQTVARRLQEAGLVADAQMLTNYLVYAGLDTRVQAGKYQLSPRMTPLEIAHALQDATPSEVTFRILAGWRLEEIAAALPTSGLTFSQNAFLDAAQNPNQTLRTFLELPPDASLEGFLFPDSYRLPRRIALDDFLALAAQNFQAKVTRDLRQGFLQQGLSVYQAVTLASIVEREAMDEEEMPLIASVFYNRMNKGMRLASDPTIQYALGYVNKEQGWWKNPLSLEDLEMISPYNTYLVDGLPQGPISAPGLSALKAVAYPAETPYYYFRAACDGSGKHRFAQTFEEHQQNACP
jgi:UPF0755 protein